VRTWTASHALCLSACCSTDAPLGVCMCVLAPFVRRAESRCDALFCAADRTCVCVFMFVCMDVYAYA
jgi:hypothetical protein